MRESRGINHLWTPAFAGVTALETFYETIKIVFTRFAYDDQNYEIDVYCPDHDDRFYRFDRLQ